MGTGIAQSVQWLNDGMMTNEPQLDLRQGQAVCFLSPSLFPPRTASVPNVVCTHIDILVQFNKSRCLIFDKSNLQTRAYAHIVL
jgi:hypothetical protein